MWLSILYLRLDISASFSGMVYNNASAMKEKTAKIPPQKRLVQWVRAHKKASLLAVFTLSIMAGFVAAYYLWPATEAAPPKAAIKKPVEPPPKVTYYAPLTGLEVKDEAATESPVTAAIIENTPAARPQSGLRDAELVFEYVAEGGITRFMALYQQQKPSLVGPIRSLRSANIDWLAPFDASILHVGGSANSLREVRSGNYRDLDMLLRPNIYWRAGDRYAPHNVYTSHERFGAFNKDAGYAKSSPTDFRRGNVKASPNPSVQHITVSSGSPTYDSAYRYQKNTNDYVRSQAGAVHKDREKGAITADVVIVMKTDMTPVHEDGYREKIRTLGSGEAIIFQGGSAKKVTWRKKDRDSQIEFIDKDSDPITLSRGKTWISVVAGNRGAAVKWQ